jgi:cytochrome P450
MTLDQSDTGLPPFPVPRQCPFEPPKVYEQWREAGPAAEVALPSGSKSWVLTRHEEVRRILASDLVTTKPSKAKLRAGVVMAGGDTSLLYLDEPEHGRYRRMLAREFSAKHINAMRPGIENIVNQCIDEMLQHGQPADLVRAFCLPIPSLVICQLLGVPYADHEYFERLASMLTSIETTPEDYASALQDLSAHFERVVSEKEEQPTDDIIGRLVVSRVRQGEMTHEQLVGFAMLLLIAGFETTATQLGMGALNLLTDHELRRQVEQDPSLWSGVIEEMLRIDSISDWVPLRTALADIEVGDEMIAAGDGVIALLGGANHDPSVFEEPCVFDPRRDNRQSFAFGTGVHSCLGQNLARAELDIAFRVLFERVPTLRLDTSLESIPFGHHAMVFGPKEVQVAW